MDGFKSQIVGAGACGIAISGLCALTCCGGFITFCVFLGKYAFANPNSACFYGTDAAGAESITGVNNAEGTLTDVHGDFVTWFTWGFVQQMIPMIGALLITLSTCIHHGLGSFCSGLVGCGAGCGGLAWWIAGLVWRYRASGKFASGDSLDEAQVTAMEDTEAAGNFYQISSGRFMSVYYMICFIILGVSCGCSLIGMIVSCLCK
jgi:hypothetical protein